MECSWFPTIDSLAICDMDGFTLQFDPRAVDMRNEVVRENLANSKLSNTPNTLQQTNQQSNKQGSLTQFFTSFSIIICRRVATSLFSSTFKSHSHNTQPIPKKPGKSDSFPPSRGGAPAAKKGGNMKVNDCDHL